MKTITNPILSIAGHKVDLVDKLQLTIAMAIVVGATLEGSKKGDKLIVHLKGAGRETVNAWDDKSPGPYFATVLKPNAPLGDAWLILEHRRGEDQLDSRTFSVKIVAEANPQPTKPDVVVSPTPTPAPDTGLPPAFTVGACIDADMQYLPLIRRGAAMGIRNFRTFASGADDAGNFGGWSTDPIKKILAAVPDAIITAMYGRQEQDDKLPAAQRKRFARPLTMDAQKRYWDQVAKATTALDHTRHLNELQNEWNADHYLNFGTPAAKINASRIAYMVNDAKFAREALGPDAYIVGPSIGYLARAADDLAWTKALIEAGILQYINAWNDHIYMSSLTELQALTGGVRELIGDRPWFATECNLRHLPMAQWVSKGAALVQTIADAKILPFVYRLYSRGNEGDLDSMCLHDKNGSLNPIVAKTWRVA